MDQDNRNYDPIAFLTPQHSLAPATGTYYAYGASEDRATPQRLSARSSSNPQSSNIRRGERNERGVLEFLRTGERYPFYHPRRLLRSEGLVVISALLSHTPASVVDVAVVLFCVYQREQQSSSFKRAHHIVVATYEKQTKKGAPHEKN